ncbi:histone acetyltransferase type B catalytic subunit-like [Watersipora subatra]|uniref:histone acetyltransferase type B catalytic subunit-like n=1 Tax=Watersipora subatra TaxID=2589382 RepID=UPI00355BDE7A
MAVTGFEKNALQEYKSDANEVVHLKLVREAKDLEDESVTFHPAMSHQVFGSSENIFGYKGLTVELYYSACRLSTYVNIKYDEMIKSEDFDGVQPDDILRAISKHIPAGFCTNRDTFLALLEQDATFLPFGEIIHSYKRSKGGCTRNFEIYKSSIEVKGFRAYHERLQTFLLWFVDAASYIDVDDGKWTFYLIYEKQQTSYGVTFYRIVGYQTVYKYYAYPQLLRPRISQVLVLPPYQRQGHGAELLEAFYRESWSDNSILDITVEDPSEEYQRLRDFVDVKNCLKLDCYSADNISKGFTSALVKETQAKLKINKKQCRRVYEIIKLKYTTAQTLKAYRLEVKKRLHQPFQNSCKDVGKMEKALTSEEHEAFKISKTEKHKTLEVLYNECVDSYRHILERVASS